MVSDSADTHTRLPPMEVITLLLEQVRVILCYDEFHLMNVFPDQHGEALQLQHARVREQHTPDGFFHAALRGVDQLLHR